MPGIVGLVTRMPRARAEAELLRMLAAIRHDPSYAVGMWTDESAGVYVGWAEREGSLAGTMPLTDAREDVVLALSGDLVPKPGIEQLLERASVDLWFPLSLNGWFHGVKIDRRTGKTTLFNDRYGMQRLYYHEADDTFYFAAEAKAILAARPELRRLDARGLGELIACGCVLENRTLFDRIHVLPCASAWVIGGGAVEARTQYFDPREWEEQSILDPEAYYEELRGAFSRALPHYLDAREPIAMSLTGGLDTRMVMAWQRHQPGSLPCYTFGGVFRDCADVRVARQVARVCRQPHEVITVGDAFLSRFHAYAERTVHLTDGCADVSRAADLYVNEQARAIAPLRMTGNYGGEVLRRVRAFKPMDPLPGLFDEALIAPIRQAHATYHAVIDAHPLSFAVFRQAPWHHHGLLALERTQLGLRSPFLDNEFVRTVFRAPASTLTSNGICRRLIADGNPALAAIATDRGPMHGRLWNAARRHASQVTYRAEYAYDYGMPQWVAPIDRLLAGLKPERLFLGRHKFYHFRLWYRDALSRDVRDMLLDPRSLARPYVTRACVEHIVNGHLSGRANHTLEIHKLLTLELVHRLFVDAQPAYDAIRPAREAVHAA
jgi:asparagine synthase (glutamine-hydrolysing)